MSLRTCLARAVASTSAATNVARSVTARSFSTSLRCSEGETVIPPKNSAKVAYDWKDALRIESSLLTEDEVAIK